MSTPLRPAVLPPLAVLLTGLLLSGCQTQPSASMPAKLADLEAKVAHLTNDWPGLARYRAANAALPAPGTARVVFMGDSITDAWPAADGYFLARGFIGRGISGQTTAQMLLRFSADVLALHPRVVVILAGTNDIADNTGPYDPVFTRDNLAAMATLARAQGVRVVLGAVLPAYDYPWRPGLQPAPKITALNAWLKDYAAAHGCTYADFHSPLTDARGGLPLAFAEDGVHPNQAGYTVMERVVDDAIATALASP